MRKSVWVAGFLGALMASQVARAETYVSDQAAALLMYPFVVVGDGNGAASDTLIQISNTSQQLVGVQCYYVNATGTCSASGEYCFSAGDCPLAVDLCLPQWVETDFRFYITGRQPLAWRASRGLRAADVPLNGTSFRGPTGESNAGSRVPPFQETSTGLAIGELKCYAMNSDGTPSDRNVLKGEATFIVNDGTDALPPGQSAKYNALGFRAIEGAVNEDNELRLGGFDPEYDGCPNVLIMNHFFDFAVNPATEDAQVLTALTLVPCTQNFVNQRPTRVTAQYLVFNEFEQRFSTSAPVDCFSSTYISNIDTPDNARSIFSVYVSGTITGQTRIRPVGRGLAGVVTELHFYDTDLATTDMFQLHQQGEREGEPDIVRTDTKN
jgi:hypothetical protein